MIDSWSNMFHTFLNLCYESFWKRRILRFAMLELLEQCVNETICGVWLKRLN